MTAEAIISNNAEGGRRSDDPMERSTRSGPSEEDALSRKACLEASTRAKTALPSKSSRLEIGIQEGLQLRFGNGTFMPRHHFTVAEEDQCGDALNR